MDTSVWLCLLVAAITVACSGCERRPNQWAAGDDMEGVLSQVLGPAQRPDGPRVAHVLVSPDGGLVLYSYWLEKPGEGWWGLVGIDGNTLTGQLDGSSTWLFPDWSPDSSSIAYSCWSGDHGGLVLKGLGTGAVDTILESEPNSPVLDVAWSPTGGNIAFTRGWRGHCDLCVVDLPSGKARPLVDGSATGIASPQWDPDGERLYFLRNVPGALYRVEARTADPEPETVGNFRDVLGLWVSPDGHLLLARGGGEAGERQTYCLVSPDQPPNSRPFAPLTSARSIAFSPDGASLMFGMVATAAAGDHKVLDLLRMSLDEPLQPQPVISGTTGLARAGAWTRDGKVVFTRDYRSIWVADADGSKQRELVSVGAEGPTDK